MDIDELSYFGKELEKTAFKKIFMKALRKVVPKRVREATHTGVISGTATAAVGGTALAYGALTQPRSIYSGDNGRFSR